jgi:hypothetical protein
MRYLENCRFGDQSCEIVLFGSRPTPATGEDAELRQGFCCGQDCHWQMKIAFSSFASILSTSLSCDLVFQINMISHTFLFYQIYFKGAQKRVLWKEI